jgi:hypothetical protein
LQLQTSHPLVAGRGSGFGRSVDDDLGRSSLHLSASSRNLLLLSSSLSSKEEMGSNVPPSSHGTTTMTTTTATMTTMAATIATAIAAVTERNVDLRGRLDRTTPSTMRYGNASVPPFSSTMRPEEGWVVVRWEDNRRVVIVIVVIVVGHAHPPRGRAIWGNPDDDDTLSDDAVSQ